MRRLWALPCALAGALLLADGILAGLLFLVWAVLIFRPELVSVSWPGHERNPPPPVRVPRLLAWPLAVVLVCSLIGGIGTIAYFLFGVGSVAGLVVAATVVVVSLRLLYRLEPGVGSAPD